MNEQVLRPVVAGLDGSFVEESVVLWAAAHASRHHRPLDLVSVVEVPVTGIGHEALVSEVPGYVERLEASAVTRLGALADAMRAAHPGLDVRVVTPVGQPAGVLVGMSEGATVVVGASRRSGLERLVLGSVSLAVVAHARGTAVVVPQENPPVEPHHVVVGADGSESSSRAVAGAVAEAAYVGGRVTVVTSWTVEVEDGVVVTEPGTERWARVEQRLTAAVSTCVERARADHPDTTVDVVVRHGSPARTILAVADEVDADLVVVGRRGRGGFAGMLTGSVSRAVVQRSTRPVAVVH